MRYSLQFFKIHKLCLICTYTLSYKLVYVTEAFWENGACTFVNGYDCHLVHSPYWDAVASSFKLHSLPECWYFFTFFSNDPPQVVELVVGLRIMSIHFLWDRGPSICRLNHPFDVILFEDEVLIHNYLAVIWVYSSQGILHDKSYYVYVGQLSTKNISLQRICALY